MGACTSAPPSSPQRGRLTDEQRRIQRQMVLDQQAEEDRIKIGLINRQRLNLQSKALPMIRKLNTCEEILDISLHGEEEYTKKRSRSNSDNACSESNDSTGSTNLDIAIDTYENKEQLLQHMNDHFEKDENDSIAVLRANKQMKRRQAKLEAESESKWMIFRDLDAFDEADMVKVAKFMDNLFKVKGKLSTSEAGSARDEALSALGALENKEGTPSDLAAEEARRLLDVTQSPSNSTRTKIQPPLNSSVGSDTSTSAEQTSNEANLPETPTQQDNASVVAGLVFERASNAKIEVVRSHSASVLSIITPSKGPLPPAVNMESNNDIEFPKGDGSAPFENLQKPQGRSMSFDDRDEDVISFKRENSMDLLRSGQVVIAGMGSGIRTPTQKGSRSPKTLSPNNSGKRASPSSGSHLGVERSRARSGSGGSGGTGSQKEEMKEDFQLQNFRIPAGFVTPLVSKAIVDVFKQGGKLSKDSIHKLLRLCYRSFQVLPNTTKVTLGENDRLTVVGDIHGQLADLLHILDQSGLPNNNNHYIFNGDFVDRGPYGVEVMCILMALYLSNPDQVTLNRGNHEDFAICCAYGFQAECCTKYDDVTFGMFVEVFNHLPLFAVVNDRVFVLHGGLFHTADVKLAELDLIKRTEFSLKDLPDGGDGINTIPRDEQEDFLKQLQRDALWSDPNGNKGLHISSRGAGVMFGPDVARKFCSTNNLSLIVRSHECCRKGFDLPFVNAENEEDRGTVCTIFSASNYGGGGNSAAYMVFTRTHTDATDATDVQESQDINVDTDIAEVVGEGDETKNMETENVKEKKQSLSRTDLRKEIRKEKAGHNKTETTIVPRTDLVYEVDYFHIDDKEQESAWIRSSASISGSEASDGGDESDISSQVSLTRDLSLHQLILRKRKLLLKHFELADPKLTGYVLKETWAEVMQRVLLLHISWTNMFTALVDDDCICYLTTDRGNRIDPTAVEGTTGFVAYERFLENYSLSIARDSAGDGGDGNAHCLKSLAYNNNNGDNGNSSSSIDGETDGSAAADGSSKRNVSGQLVDSLYAHHNELSVIFSFFDMKKDQVISREEFKAGCRIIRKLINEDGEQGDTVDVASGAAYTEEDDEHDAECDMLMDIMNLNGSGYIDINEFFEMFRLSDVMAKRSIGSADTPKTGQQATHTNTKSHLQPPIQKHWYDKSNQ